MLNDNYIIVILLLFSLNIFRTTLRSLQKFLEMIGILESC